MRLTQLSFLILILILLGIASCEKDIEIPQKDNADTASFIEGRNNPFFDDEAITTITNASIESSIPDWYKQYTKEYLQNQPILIANISSNLGVVCWNCAEIEMISTIGARYAYFPVISTQSGTVSGLLITKFFDSEVITTYVADLSLLQAVTTNYWPQIFGFFNQKIQGQSPSKDGVFGSRMLACEESGATGFCICRTGESCGGISNCQQITCDGNGGGVEEEDGSFPDPLESLDEFYEWLWGSAWWLGDGEGTLEGGGASNPGALNGKGFFNLSYFGGFNDYLIAGLVNDFKRRHDIYMPADQLYNQLLECGVDTYLEFKYDLFTSYQDLSDCIKNIILQNNILHLEEEDGFILTEEEIQEIYPDVMLYSGDFPAYKKTGLINYLDDVLEFSDGIESWLNSNGQYFSYSVLIYEYLNANDFSEESKDVTNSTFNFVEQKGFEDNASKAAKAVLAFVERGKLEGPYTDDERDEIVEDYFINNPDLYIQYITHCIILRTEWENNNPGQTCGILCLTDIALEAYWKTVGGVVHTALDICGLVPAWGEPCDLVNGTLYLIEGDGVNATISFAASIPIVGWVATGSRWVKIAIEVAPGVYKNLKITRQASGLLTFSHNTSTAFRQILNITGPNWTSFQAHHLIPKNFANHTVVQKAASSRDFTFHMNHPRNGTPIHNSRHQGYHNNYNNQIEDLLDDLEETYPNATASEIATALEGFQAYLRNTVEQSSQHINDIIIDYTW
ncbi:MAG: AHH domain-containing protein [Chitinophagales bacterium]|nr:AHH domain-containing protein [Chitinophagales bacterium]